MFQVYITKDTITSFNNYRNRLIDKLITDFDLNKWGLRLSRETIVKSPSPAAPEWCEAYCTWISGFRSDDIVMESSTATTVLQLKSRISH